MYLVKSDKTLVPAPGKMYRKLDSPPTTPSKFELPFEGKLSQDNRWVRMANLIPWDEFEEEYAKNFACDIGAPALPFRMALGSLIIKERLGISDRETVEQIKENPCSHRPANPSRQWLRGFKLHSIQKLTGGCGSLSSTAMDV